MPRTKLTEAKIKTLATTKPQEDHFHERTPNAGLRISRGGRKTWFFLYRDTSDTQRRHLLGEHPGGKRGQARYLSLQEFEAQYDILRGDMRRGIEPSLSTGRTNSRPPESTARMTSPDWMKSLPLYCGGTFADLAVQYFDWCVKKRKLATRTLTKYQLIANAHLLPRIGTIQMASLATSHLREVLKDKADSTIEDIRKTFNNAFHFGTNEHLDFMSGLLNPFPRTQLTASRNERWFRDEDLRAIIPAIKSLADRDASDVYTLMLLTGCRTDEAVNVKAEDLIEMNGEKVWLLPTTKMNRSFVIPPLGRVGDVLDRRCLQVGGKGYLFWPHSDRTKYVWQLTKANKAMRKLSKVMDFEPYSFRHTFRTNLSALRVVHEVAEAALNHVARGVARNYNHWDYWQERKEALALWHEKLEKLQGQEVDIAA